MDEPLSLSDAIEIAQRELAALRNELRKRAELREQAAQVVESMRELPSICRELAELTDKPVAVARLRIEWRPK